MKLTEYTIKNNNFKGNLVFALVSDLHGCAPDEAIAAVKKISPDYILAPGDIFELMDGSCDDVNEAGYKLLGECARLAPTFYSPGNHEVGATKSWMGSKKDFRKNSREISERDVERLRSLGVHFLDGACEICDGIAFAGIGTGLINTDRRPDVSVLNEFMRLSCPKVLLCHHPEYYKSFFADSDIDLIVSGHAHGGQWRIFGRGVYAPGQGLFPKYTSGVHDGKLVISRGLKVGDVIPRIFNPPEVVKITVIGVV